MVGAAAVLGSNELVISKAEYAGVAVIHEGHRPAPTKGISDGVSAAAVVFEHILAAVLQLDLVAVAITLRHLLELAGAIKHPLTSLAEAAVARVCGDLASAAAGTGIAVAAAEELLGEALGHVRLAPAVVPALAFLDAAGLTGAEAEVVAGRPTAVLAEPVSGELAEVNLGDPNRRAVAVVADLADLIADDASLGIGKTFALGEGRKSCQRCADQSCTRNMANRQNPYAVVHLATKNYFKCTAKRCVTQRSITSFRSLARIVECGT